ncbi:ROK family protein [Lapidilactobacillus luobeiensis]|uniref:ROK family protein n=1 Tax=Lapidilactobacillus luobeiensis TaxID=2950371 RepID=UPI0021C3CF46|nr:ROK family protein [Lapidilactobacillus luobeiensis]
MQYKKNLVRVLNEQRVLQQAFNFGPISRSQISKNLKLNKVTVSDIVASLIDQHYLLELGQGDSTENGGRKPTILKFNADLGYVINFDLGYDYIDRMFNLMDGQVVSLERYPAKDMSIDDRLELMTSLIHTERLDDQIPLRGVSVAIHGIIDKNQILYAPFIDFKSLDVAKILTDKLGVPVLLENEANLSVIYERDFESNDDIDNIVCISVHKGIGAGIVINNHLYTGKHGEAGEIGHTIIYDHDFRRRRAPNTIESYCSEDAILDMIRQIKAQPNLGISEIVELYYQHDSDVEQILDDFCFYIANIIYNTIVTLDPRRVALNSNLIATIPELLPKIKANIPYLTNDETQVYLVDDVRSATLLGGCSLIIQHLLKMQSGQLAFRR